MRLVVCLPDRGTGFSPQARWLEEGKRAYSPKAETHNCGVPLFLLVSPYRAFFR